MRVHAETFLPALGLEAEEIKKHKRLQQLAQVARAHESRDRPVSAAGCAVNDGARWCGDDAVHRFSSSLEPIALGMDQRAAPSKAAGFCRQATKADIANSTRAGAGLPPITKRCVTTAPVMVAVSSSPAKKLVTGMSNNTAPATSMAPVR